MSDSPKTETRVDAWIRAIKTHPVLARAFLVALGFLSLTTIVDGWSKLATFARVESLIVQSSRVEDLSYETEVRHEVSVTRSMPTPYFAHAYWDLVLVNNSDRDISILKYEIEPLSTSLPSAGPYRAGYEQGLFDASSKPVVLPVVLASGHALRMRVRTWVVVSSYNIKPEVTKHWQSDGCPGKPVMWDFFYNCFAKHGVDFFGNEVSAGPGGILPSLSIHTKNQELLLRLTTGRGKTLTSA